MGPKGIGPQKLGAGMSSQKSDCCGIPNCGCSGSPAKNASAGYGYDLKSPAKIVGAVAGMVGKALVGKAVEKMASPNKRHCKK